MPVSFPYSGKFASAMRRRTFTAKAFPKAPGPLASPAMAPSPVWRIALFSALMIVCASASNAVMDVLWTRFDQSGFAHFEKQRQWLDPRISWKNKWKNGDRQQGEAFFLSSTSLAPLTDAWHGAKAVTILCLALAIIAPFTRLVRWPWYAWIGVLVGIDLLYGLVFESLYGHLLMLR